MLKRSITGLIMGLVLIPLMIFPQMIIPFQIIMILGVVIASLELIKMFEKEKELKIEIKVVTVVLSLIVYAGTAWFTLKGDLNNISNYMGNKFIMATLLVVLISLGLNVFGKDFSGDDVGKVLTTVFYVGLGAGSLVVLRVLGFRFISYLILTTVSTDVFAYLFGVKFGKNKMAPNISPKKSWEGAIAGTVIATILAGLYGLYFGKIFTGGILNPTGINTIIDGTGLTGNGIEKTLIFVMTFLLSIIGQIGDLVASKFKRTYDIKDFGNVFPGHGGVLDRFDSAFFAGIFLVMVLMLFTI